MFIRLRNKKLTALILFVTLCVFSTVAQNVVIKGQVLSEDGKEPLIAATVMVPSSETKRLRLIEIHNALTDIDGHFSITLPEKVKALEFRYLGYITQVVPVNGTQELTVIMKPSNTALEEVVVTGYQKIEKRKLTASISNVTVNDNMRGSAMSIDQALAGQVAGLASTTTSGDRKSVV